MIGALHGQIFRINPQPILIMVHDVGYAVHITPHVAQSIKLNDQITVYTYFHVREDIHDIYGFLSQKELDAFTLLLSVSGVGPRTAMSIIDKGVTQLFHAITQSDVEFFTTIPRLGKKNAQKIIIELKNKVNLNVELSELESQSSSTKTLLDALISMGFARKESIDAIKQLTATESTLEAQMRKVLQILGSK